jgi:hypothetical protein
MTISKFDAVIDSRDIIKRIEELQNEYDELMQSLMEFDEENPNATNEKRSQYLNSLDDWLFDNKAELDSLLALQEQCEGYSDWEYGETLIHEAYWVDYCKELLEDCGEIPRELPWYIEIDWEKTAENLSDDYTTVDFDGETYYIRNC